MTAGALAQVTTGGVTAPPGSTPWYSYQYVDHGVLKTGATQNPNIAAQAAVSQSYRDAQAAQDNTAGGSADWSQLVTLDQAKGALHPIAMSLAKNAPAGLSEQALATILASRGQPTVASQAFTAQDRQLLGLPSSFDMIKGIDPSQANFGANNWSIYNPQANGFLGESGQATFKGMIGLAATALGANYLAGLGGAAADAAGGAAADAAAGGFGTGQGMLSAYGDAAAGGLGTVGDMTLGSTFYPQGLGALTADGISAGVAATNPYIGNSIRDLATTDPTGSVPTNNWLENQVTNLTGNGNVSPLKTASDLYRGASTINSLVGALGGAPQGSSTASSSSATAPYGGALSSVGPNVNNTVGNLYQATNYARGGLARYRRAL
jgi:hypothetical protein